MPYRSTELTNLASEVANIPAEVTDLVLEVMDIAQEVTNLFTEMKNIHPYLPRKNYLFGDGSVFGYGHVLINDVLLFWA